MHILYDFSGIVGKNHEPQNPEILLFSDVGSKLKGGGRLIKTLDKQKNK